MNNSRKSMYTWKDKLKAIGPGAMITASFIGPGTVTTATRAGAEYGYALLWTVIFSIVATMILQEMAARIGVITQKGLGAAIVESSRSSTTAKLNAFLVGGAVALGCAAYMSGDLTGTSLGINTLTNIPIRVIGPIIGVIVLILVSVGSFKLIERFLTALVAVMAVVFITTMIVAKPNWGEVASGVVPTNISRGNIVLIISMIGTTVVPYNFFMHATSAMKNWHKPEELELSKWDTYLSITVGGLITAAIVITSGTLMRGHIIENAADISIQLEPLLGKWAKVFMSIGLFSAGLSSATASPLGAAFTLASLFGWKPDVSDKRFKYTNIIIVSIGIFVTLLGLKPIALITAAQALNGIILPIVAVYLVKISSDEKILGEYANKPAVRIIGWIVAAVMVFLGGYSLITAFA